MSIMKGYTHAPTPTMQTIKAMQTYTCQDPNTKGAYPNCMQGRIHDMHQVQKKKKRGHRMVYSIYKGSQVHSSNMDIDELHETYPNLMPFRQT